MRSEQYTRMFLSSRRTMAVYYSCCWILLILLNRHVHALVSRNVVRFFGQKAQQQTSRCFSSVQQEQSSSSVNPTLSISEASQILAEWDRRYNAESAIANAASSSSSTDTDDDDFDSKNWRNKLVDAVHALNEYARRERDQDATKGRCMLGICADSAQIGIGTLKTWVTQLQLPRGLLHGMDTDGVPIQLDGSVYIKYNSGGVYTFADIRKSNMGFDALWKPGDALLEPYDGQYRGVYFQVELSDGEFRQYLVPLDLFDSL